MSLTLWLKPLKVFFVKPVNPRGMSLTLLRKPPLKLQTTELNSLVGKIKKMSEIYIEISVNKVHSIAPKKLPEYILIR